MAYQRKWIEDKSQFKVWEKSRRIGASWTEALNSVLEAVAGKGKNTLYLSYNKDMTEQFVRDCEFWAKLLNGGLKTFKRKEIVDENKGILGFQIRFSNGRTIKALSSEPRNIRSKQARVVIDEGAFCDSLGELLKAAIALLMWGGSVCVLSTHDGVDNEFNELIEGIKNGDRADEEWSLHRTDLDDALADGLYKRICLVQGKEWTLEGEFEWRKQLVTKYGIDADEELFCIAFQGKAGKVFASDKILVVNPDEIPAGGQEVRFWDLAATEKKLKGDEPCFTAGIKMKIVDRVVYVLDLIMVQESAGAVDELIKQTAISDGKQCQVRWELEGGSSGIRDASHITKLLMGFDAKPVRPTGDKVTRAKPYASQVNAGNVRMVRATWNNRYRKDLYGFPDAKVRDDVDASSGAFSCLTTIAQRVPPSGSWSSW